MLPLARVIQSTVFRKFLMALSGLGLVVFVIVHLAGNSLLYFPTGGPFNAYAYKLESQGAILEALELGLLLMLGLHVLSGVLLKKSHRMARPSGYKVYHSKKGPSKANPASRSMIITGLVLLVFLVLHIKHFKFGPGIAEGYITEVNGMKVRDLQRWVVEQFHNPVIVGLYVGVMLLLGMHVRHGFWSAFQSLGLVGGRVSLRVYLLSALIGLALALGFMFIPIWIYFGLGGH